MTDKIRNGTMVSGRLLYGVGISDANYPVRSKENKIICLYYQRWFTMMMRGYCKSTKDCNPAYKNTTVCKEWLTFSVFREWMIEQDWEGKEIDKDLIIKGNQEYSPEACSFVPKKINLLKLSPMKSKAGYLMGVTKHKRAGADKYHAAIKIRGKVYNLGFFKTEYNAWLAYKQSKEFYVKQVAQEYYDKGEIPERVYKALMEWTLDEG